MCNEVKIKIPENVVIKKNWGDGRKLFTHIDKCIVEDIKKLWGMGIRTTGCCCGHETQKGYISVVIDDIEKMEKLGYKNLFKNKKIDHFETKKHLDTDNNREGE